MLTLVRLTVVHVAAIVQFKFNTPELAISEGEDLSNQLFILKNGQNEMNITFQVRIIPGTASENTGSNKINVYGIKV